jgi:hypothetical protein
MNWERVKKVLLALGKLVLTAALTVVFKALFATQSAEGLGTTGPVLPWDCTGALRESGIRERIWQSG